MVFTVKQTLYNIGTDPVTIVTQHEFGLKNFDTTQPALTARTTGGTGVWGDTECVAEVQTQLDAQYPGAGHTAALYVAPAV